MTFVANENGFQPESPGSQWPPSSPTPSHSSSWTRSHSLQGRR
ncbi:UNVERIFIED_CONTAM: hypothetical protein GTU68_035485 [Idotea baltica]|nr:hypothetical protein [Idotea baltica]